MKGCSQLALVLSLPLLGEIAGDSRPTFADRIMDMTAKIKDIVDNNNAGIKKLAARARPKSRGPPAVASSNVMALTAKILARKEEKESRIDPAEEVRKEEKESRIDPAEEVMSAAEETTIQKNEGERQERLAMPLYRARKERRSWFEREGEDRWVRKKKETPKPETRTFDKVLVQISLLGRPSGTYIYIYIYIYICIYVYIYIYIYMCVCCSLLLMMF